MKKTLAILIGLLAVVVCMGMVLPAPTINFDAPPLTAKIVVTRFLVGGSSIEHKFVTEEPGKMCQGGRAVDQTRPNSGWVKTCTLQLEKVSDLEYVYRFVFWSKPEGVMKKGVRLGETVCKPVEESWECLALYGSGLK